MKFLSAAIIALALVLATDAEARMWKPTPRDLAIDYLGLKHVRSKRELVIVMWIAPPMVPDAPKYAMTRKLLRDYVIVTVIHYKVNDYGAAEFFNPKNVVLETAAGERRKPLAPEDMPPLVRVTVNSLIPEIFSSLIGQVGQNAKTHVFDGAGIDACGEGGMWLHYAGERYEFLTPIPGCK